MSVFGAPTSAATRHVRQEPIMTQAAKAETFRALHRAGDPLILFNAWDAGSARAIADAGAKAIATGSFSVAAAHGFGDGEEQLPLDLALANLVRIVATVDLPVSLDFERGYGETPADVANSIAAAIAAGAIGFNIEDSFGRGLRAADAQAERLAAARAAATQSGVTAFLNARIDTFLINPPQAHSEAHLAEAMQRAALYVAAGADGVFLPGLADAALIAIAAAGAPAPLNIMAMRTTPDRATLASLGVARISHGPGPWRLAMRALSEAAEAALG
ncbi:MAG: isocitrate lyase/PEP mutase family protein [Caulobacterales bacterium]|jgi:2-methylisocitrate lyase-like PEP mutase family enzyme